MPVGKGSRQNLDGPLPKSISLDSPVKHVLDPRSLPGASSDRRPGNDIPGISNGLVIPSFFVIPAPFLSFPRKREPLFVNLRGQIPSQSAV
jgi:hypothetical protein